MNLEDYQNKIDEIEAIPEDELKLPNAPVSIMVQEAENQFEWCKDDKKELTKTGLDWNMVLDIPARAGALRQSESNWKSVSRARQDAEKEWKEKSPGAYDLRDRLVHDFTYAFRNEDELKTKLAEIRDGDGHADMIQDLSDLSVLGKSNTPLLKTIGFDVALLDEAAAMSDNMGSLLAEVNGERAEQNEAKIIRDKAYTYLKQAVDELRACGKYVFWRDPERLKGYRSEYHKKHN